MSETAGGIPVTGSGATVVSIASGPLVGPVLRRVVGMLAARANLPLDRLDDAVLVADLIAARAPAHAVDESVRVVLEPQEHSLALQVGPLRAGGAAALISDAAVPGVGNVIEQLTDSLEPVTGDDGDHLQLRLSWAAGD